MTVMEMDAACAAQSSVLAPVGAFTKAFRETELMNIEEGESFVIPQDYKIWQQRMMRNGEPITDRQGNQVTSEFINVVTNKGRSVRFYPSSVCKIAYAVDENGKDVIGAGRIVKTEGPLSQYARGKAINDVMLNLRGCEVKLEKLNHVNTRAFGVSNENATAKDIVPSAIGTWNVVGDKKPAGWQG